jgi:hypothetical protein
MAIGLAKDLVIGGTSTPEIIIIHGRQIVMDQGIGMDHLHGAGSRHGLSIFPPTAWQAASISTGRTRLPPAKTE